MSEHAAILARIKKLRALSSSDNPHEAEAAARIAARLLSEHRISEVELLVDEAIPAAEAIVDGELAPMARFVHWRSYLLEVLCSLHGCAHLFHKPKGRGYVPRVYGTREDLELVRETYTWLCLSVEQAASKACEGRGEKFSQSYKVGIVYGIRDAIQEAKAEAERKAPSAALAVLDERAKEAARRVAKALRGADKAPKNPAWLDEEGYSKGHKKGRNLQGRLPSKRKGDLGGRAP